MSLILLIPLFFAGVALVFAIGWVVGHIFNLDKFNELETQKNNNGK